MTHLERYYIFIQEHQPTIKIGNIELIPDYSKELDTIVWELYNPRNQSYNSYVLKGYIDELLNTFSEYVGKNFYHLLQPKQKLETRKTIYITPEDEEKFLRLAQKTTKFKYKEIQMDIYPFDINIRMDGDVVYFDVFVVCLNPYDTIEKTKLTYVDLKDKLNYYKEWDSYFDYTDNLFNDLQDYIWNNHPALFNNEYMLTQGGISYFTPTHKQLKLW